MRFVCIAVALCFLPRLGYAAALATFTFPNEPASVASPSGMLSATFVPVDDDHASDYRFAVRDSDGKELAGFTFLRNVDGVWHGPSNNLFVNNRSGSNIADCLVYRNGGSELESLRERLNHPESGPKDTAWIKPSELGKDSHYFLTCEKWQSEEVVDLIIEGHTDYAGEEFKYHLRYDLGGRSFALRNP